MAYENYTIKQFSDALFKDDRSVMSEEELNTVNTEYLSTSGLFEQDEFQKVSTIYFLNNRINSIKLSVQLQKQFLKNFGKPYIPGLKFFKKFGHTIYWNNEEQFTKELDKIEIRESKYISQMEGKIKELMDLRKKRPAATQKTTRESFIRTVISLGKIGYKIENDKTTVEELAFMIKSQMEEAEQVKSK